MQTEEMVEIEFYLLGEDKTWDTDYIAIPKTLYDEYKRTFNPDPVTTWVHKNAPLHRDICMVGIYNDEPLENDDEEV